MSLTPNFALTPIGSFFTSPKGWARMSIRGPSFFPNYPNDSPAWPYSFDLQYRNDQVLFSSETAADPDLDYTSYFIRKTRPHIQLTFDVKAAGRNKELALLFGFEALSTSRILVFSHADKLGDVTLEVGDTQFLIEVESIDHLVHLYFVHARGPSGGGAWVFRGFSGYVI